MTAQAEFFGGARLKNVSADLTLVAGSARVQILTPQFDGNSVFLPAPSTFVSDGGPAFYVVNVSASYDLAVRDDGGVLLVTLAGGEAAVCVMGGSAWRVQVLGVDS